MRVLRAVSRLFAALSCLPLGGCAALKLGVMNAAGPIAAEQWRLYLIVGAVLIFVAGPVLILTPLFAWHYRLSNKREAFRPTWDFSWTLEGFIWIPPTAIVIGLGVVLWRYTFDLDPYLSIVSDQPPLEVQAVGLDWKWLFIYPGERVAAINKLVIPVGRPVHIRLTSGTVMQSLMIPQLAGQIYAMPGMTTQLNLAASRAGVFRGENTQFNGVGFQNETFDVVASPTIDFDRWIAEARASDRALDDAALADMFKPSSPPAPVVFSSVPPGLFQDILAQTREPRS